MTTQQLAQNMYESCVKSYSSSFIQSFSFPGIPEEVIVDELLFLKAFGHLSGAQSHIEDKQLYQRVLREFDALWQENVFTKSKYQHFLLRLRDYGNIFDTVDIKGRVEAIGNQFCNFLCIGARERSGQQMLMDSQLEAAVKIQVSVFFINVFDAYGPSYLSNIKIK